jgi:predicted secreted protein
VETPETIELAVGETTEIRLPSHISSGYRWEHQVDSQTGSPVVSIAVDDAPRARPSGPGTREPGYVVIVRGETAGTARIEFVLRRSWEQAPAERSYVEVRVHPADAVPS